MVPNIGEVHLKNIEFRPNDFKYMELSSGNMVYALPITLNPNKINIGDIIILKWRDFKLEKEVD